MSLVALKRKTQAKYNNNSVGYRQFSLNGTTRSQGWVGQTTLSRSLPKTVMVGNVAKGYGGCCGTYIRAPIINSAVSNENDPDVVKASVMTTSGLFETNYSEIKVSGSDSCISWKPDTNSSANSTQSTYIVSVKEHAIQYADISGCAISASQPSQCCYDLYESDKNVNTMSQSDYLTQLKSQCYDSSNNIFYLPNNTINVDTVCRSST
jgi:hypothetical protein